MKRFIENYLIGTKWFLALVIFFVCFIIAGGLAIGPLLVAVAIDNGWWILLEFITVPILYAASLFFFYKKRVA